MKAFYQGYFWLYTIIICCACCAVAQAQGPIAINYVESGDNSISFSPIEISDQIRSLPDPLVMPHYDKVIASYIKTYTVKSRDRTERMLGKMQLYFPLFEKHLMEAGLPLALKYVPVLESALDPMATSRSGAAGLWQIMPITAKHLKLRVSRYVDDRRDPEKSTKAAVAYLKKLYQRFGSWELTLAAYNGGPGRVSRAMRRTGINDFWALKKHLPRETRNYVSAFLSANYIGNYYHQYGLEPKAVDDRFYDTQMIEVTQLLRFSEVAAIAGMEEEQIQAMNPRYPRGYIPERSKGQLVKLPALEAAILKNRMGLSGYSASSILNHQKGHYEVQPADNYMQVCRDLKCSPASLAQWNGLQSIALSSGQVLTYFTPEAKKPKRIKYTVPNALDSKNSRTAFDSPLRKYPFATDVAVSNFKFHSKPIAQRSIQKIGKRKVYVVKAGESLLSISRALPEITLQDLMHWNDLSLHSSLRPGQILQLK